MNDTRAPVLAISGQQNTGEGSAPVTQGTVRLPGIELVMPPPPALEPGFILGGRYELEEALGMGGAGRVYRARDRYVKATVAVKILRGDRAIDKKWIERFAREVRVAREIRHPNVCRVYEFGEADGYWYLTMEYADEGTLQEALNKRSVMRIKKGVIPAPRNPVADARAVCAGLAAIHTVGIVHRDVTPGNILRSNGRLLLTDFGLAIGDKEQTTFHGGTPRFMAPEVIAGAPADQRSDVYQLGYLLHEVLFNKHPHWTHDEAGHRILNSPAVPDADPVEEAMAALCLECLSDNPALRPASAIIVAEKLAEAERAQRKSWIARKWTRVNTFARRPAVVATATLLCLGLVATKATRVLGQQTLCGGGPARIAGTWDPERIASTRSAFLATGRPDANRIFDAANQAIADHLAEWLLAYKEACEATQVRGEQSADVLDLRMGCLTEDLESVGVVASLLSQATPEVVDNAAFSVSANVRDLGRCSNLNNLRTSMPLPKDPAVRARVENVQRALAGLSVASPDGNDTAVRDATARLADEAHAIGYCPLIAKTLMARASADGLAYRVSGDPTVVSELTDALWTAESCGDDADVARAGAYLVFAERYSDKEPDRWARMTEAALKRIGGDPETEALLANNLGVVLHHRGDYAAGVEQYRHAVALAGSLPGHASLGLYLLSLSDGLKEMGSLDEALTASDRGLDVLRTSMGSNSFPVAELLTNRGDLFTSMHRYQDAEQAYRQSLSILERQLPADNFGLTYPIAGIGKALVEQGSSVEAVSWLERAASRDTGGDPYFAAGIKFDLARALCATGADCPRGQSFAAAALAAYKDNPNFHAEAERVGNWLQARRAHASD
jgi:tRNA A-37 threonylcarbamoyl transferase component Bud32/tetratricopeptide (TPR) repeat protein